MAAPLSIKHLKIIRAGNQLTTIVTAAVVISVFCLLSTKSLLSQSSYQRRVLAAKNTAANQLKVNASTANQLLAQFKVFEDNNPNIIGGQGGANPGSGPSDGDNARIVLDALPSQYDFPALVSSLEKILNNEGISAQSVGGTDQGQVARSSSLGNSQPVPLTFSVDASGNYKSIQQLINDLERSIRPMDITNLSLSGTQSNMHVSINATTYYQPATNFTVTQRELR